MEYNKELNKNQSNKINCFDCKYFSITWNANFPRACSMFGFKGKELPSQQVFRTTGEKCPSFQKKV